MIFGSQLFRPWFTKKMATAMMRTNLINGFPRSEAAPWRAALSSRNPPVAIGAAERDSSRAVSSNHSTQMIPMAAASTRGTLRQLPPARGRMTLLAVATAMI